MSSILHIINQIAADPSRKAKEAILETNKDNESLKAVFKACYDPTVQYYIKKIPEYDTSFQDVLTIDQCLERLKYLASRNVTGNDAIMHLKSTLQSAHPTDAVVIERIIQRDLKCGATDSTANKIWKGLIPEFPYMRCSLVKDAKFDKWDWKKGAFSQIKADGMFCNADITDEDVTLTSRQGKELPGEKFRNLIEFIGETSLTNVRLTGELLLERDGKILPREIGNGLIQAAVKGDYIFGDNERPVYDVWDILPLDQCVPSGRIKTSYAERYSQLTSFFTEDNNDVRAISTKIVYNLEEAYVHYFELIALGYEGTIIKNPDGEWFDGTSRDQIKLKVECTVELEITGFNEGNGKNAATFGSIESKSSCGKLVVNVSGFTDKERIDINARRDELMNTIMSVTFNNIMPPAGSGIYSLFLPRFAEFRTDRTEADSLERIIEQFEAVVKPKK